MISIQMWLHGRLLVHSHLWICVHRWRSLSSAKLVSCPVRFHRVISCITYVILLLWGQVGLGLSLWTVQCASILPFSPLTIIQAQSDSGEIMRFNCTTRQMATAYISTGPTYFSSYSSLPTEIRRVMLRASDSSLKQSCSAYSSTTSALEVDF